MKHVCVRFIEDGLSCWRLEQSVTSDTSPADSAHICVSAQGCSAKCDKSPFNLYDPTERSVTSNSEELGVDGAPMDNCFHL